MTRPVLKKELNESQRERERESERERETESRLVGYIHGYNNR